MALPARVNQANGNNYTGTTATTQATSAFAVTAGNHLAVLVRSAGGVTVTGVTDTAGNTYVKAGNTSRLEMWYAQNILGHATNIVTVTFSAVVAYRDVTAVQHSGLRTTSSLGHFAGNTVGSGTTVSCIPSVSYVAEQVCVTAADLSASGTFTFTPSGFTALFTNSSISIAARTDLVRVFDGSVSVTGTSANSAADKQIVAAVFLGVETTPAGRVTQAPVEVLSQPVPDARVTHHTVELLTTTMPIPGRVSQYVVEVLSANPVVSNGAHVETFVWGPI